MRDAEIGVGGVADLGVEGKKNPDAELALRKLEVFRPDSPVVINGTPFSVVIDENLLVSAVNIVAAESRIGLDIYPEQLTVELSGEASLEVGKDSTPLISIEDEVDKPDLLSSIEDGRTAINIVLPANVKSLDYSDTGLANIFTAKANEDLFKALEQNYVAIRKRRRGRYMTGVALSAMVGEGIGIELADTTLPQTVGFGVGGAIAGGLLGLMTPILVDYASFGSSYKNPKKRFELIKEKAIGESKWYKISKWNSDYIRGKDGPIISLVPESGQDN